MRKELFCLVSHVVLLAAACSVEEVGARPPVRVGEEPGREQAPAMDVTSDAGVDAADAGAAADTGAGADTGAAADTLMTEGGSPDMAQVPDALDAQLAGEIPEAQAPAVMAAVYCNRKYDCCTAAELATTFFSDRESCLLFTSAIVREILLEVARESGRATYDGRGLHAAVRTLEPESCGVARDKAYLGTMLQVAIKPLVARGGACTFSPQCIGGYCAGATETTPGSCVTSLKPNGRSCTEGDQCTSGYCGDDRKCAPPPSEYRLCGE